MTGIFISYRRDDTQLIRGRIAARLVEHFGSDAVFVDLDKIRPGQDFLHVITEALAACEVQVLLIGERWKRSRRRLQNPDDVVRLEIETALARGLELIPVLVDQAAFPNDDELPSSLHALLRLNALRLSSGPGFDADAQRLVDAVEARIDTAARRHPPGPWPAERWTALPQPAQDTVVALARDGATMYAAALHGRRILRWRQGSRPWVTFATLPDACTPKCLAVADPGRASALWVGTEGRLLWTEGALSGWRSLDYFDGLGDRGVRTIAVDPADPARVMVGTGRYSSGTSASASTVAGAAPQDLGEERWVADVGSGDLHVSRDGGRSWKTGPFRNVNRVAIPPGDPARIYVATADDGLFVSSSGGAAYTLAPGTPAHTLYALAVSPRDPDTVAIGTASHGAWISRDAGAAFTPLPASGATEVLAIAFDPADPDAMLVCADEGLYESSDAARSFQRPDADLVHPRALAACWGPGSTCLIGTDGGGLYGRAARGQRWAQSWRGGMRLGIGAIAVGPSAAVYVGAAGQVCVTEDDGRTFQPLLQTRSVVRTIAVLPDPPAQRDGPLVVGWGRDRTLLAGTEDGEIHRSDDFGMHWACVQRERAGAMGVRGLTLAQDGTVYAVLTTSALLASDDRGQTWRRLPASLHWPTAIAVAPPPWRVLVAGTYDTGVHWSGDAGLTWTPLGEALPPLPVLALRLVRGEHGVRVLAGLQEGGLWWLDESTPRWRRASGPGRTTVHDIVAGDECVLAAAEHGLFVSVDQGQRWRGWSDGLPEVEQITRVAWAPQAHSVYAGEHQGLYVRRLEAGARAPSRPARSSIPNPERR